LFTWSAVAPQHLCVRGVSLSPTALWLAAGTWPRPCWRTHLMRLALGHSERSIVFLDEEYSRLLCCVRGWNSCRNEGEGLSRAPALHTLRWVASLPSVCVCVCVSADDAFVFVSELFIYVQEISVWYIITNNPVPSVHTLLICKWLSCN